MTQLDVKPMAGRIGAEIHGVDLAAPLEPGVVDAIQHALDRHLVIFFPRQRLAPESQLAFARQFGEPEGKHPFIPHAPGFEQVAVLNAADGGRADLWHTDVTFAEQPPMGSILHMRVCPEYGGDTMWANMYAAYESLSEPMQSFLAGLSAQHEITAAARSVLRKDRFRPRPPGGIELPKDVPTARHPVVRTHPKTGRKHALRDRGLRRRAAHHPPRHPARREAVLRRGGAATLGWWEPAGAHAMSLIPRFAEYAAAFEVAYQSDDWKPIEPFFAPDAVYEIPGVPAPIGGRMEGRDAILAYFKAVLDGFDRRFDTRAVSLTGAPREDGDTVSIRGRVVYTSSRAPRFEFELEERATFDAQGCIRRLEDRYDDATIASLRDYLRAHGKTLGLAGA